jgi:phosphate-selective porin OprO/OprP
MVRNTWKLAGSVGLAALMAAGSAKAQTADQMDKMQAQIKQLERDLAAMKSKVNTAEKTANTAAQAAYAAHPATKAPAVPQALVKMSAGNRPAICSADGLNCIAITSRLHLDAGGSEFDGPAGSYHNGGVNARRARIGILGTFMGDWNYNLTYDFGGSSDGFGGLSAGALSGGGTSGINNAYISYVGIKSLAIEAGYMDVPYTLDEATSSNDILFMERASSQVVATSIAAGDNRSAAGIRGNNDWFWAGAYVTGPASGTNHNGSTTDEQFGAVGRVAMNVINEKDYTLHIGGNVLVLFDPAESKTGGVGGSLTLSDRPELRVDPQNTITSGAILGVKGAQVYSAEAAASAGSFFFQGEYFFYNIERERAFGDSLRFDGGYAQASWVITGENHAYNPGSGAYAGIVPKNPFDIKGSGWGAWEVAVRYSRLDLNDQLNQADGVEGGVQTIVTAGLNWYVNRNIRFMLDYSHGELENKRTGVTGTANPTTPVDATMSWDSIATRMQVAF